MRSSLLSLGIFTVIVLSTLSAIADESSQTLICRGGLAMRIGFSHVAETPHARQRTVLILSYVKAVAPASAKAPSAGECALQSNVFKPGDPQSFFLESATGDVAFKLMGNGQLYVDGAGPLVHAENENEVERRKWETIIQGVFRGQPFSLTVFHPVSGANIPGIVRFYSSNPKELELPVWSVEDVSEPPPGGDNR